MCDKVECSSGYARPIGLPHLPYQRLAEVQELVLLEVLVRVRVIREKVVCGFPV